VAFVIDVFARRIVGWKVSARPAPTSCSMRWSRRCMPDAGRRRGGLIHHSDRGVQYVSIRYTERLAEAGIEPSVGSVGDSYDNALAETINGLYKAEVIHRRLVAEPRSRRTGHARLGRLVQPSAAAGADRQHPAGRGRSPSSHTSQKPAAIKGPNATARDGESARVATATAAIHAIPASDAASRTVGKAAQPNHAPAAAMSFASPMPRPSLPRKRR
jgi:transposase InsO family protein